MTGTGMDSSCSIARSLGVVGERWTLLILREAVSGVTRFSQFREALGLAPDVLTARLATLVDSGVMKRVSYQEPGRRSQSAYELTPAGRDLRLVLGALQQWGDTFLPWPAGPTILRQERGTARALHVGFVDEDGREVHVDNVVSARTAAYPT